jgi:hypothetical protein
MLIVLKEMLKEAGVFFLLLIVIIAGFLQAFFGLDSADETVDVMNTVVNSMTQALLQAPDFTMYSKIAPPFGLLLFYLFNFLISVRTPRVVRSDSSATEHSRGIIQSSVCRRDG